MIFQSQISPDFTFLVTFIKCFLELALLCMNLGEKLYPCLWRDILTLPLGLAQENVKFKSQMIKDALVPQNHLQPREQP